MRTYLDHNATSPLRPAVKAAMLAAMEVHGNPSSIHGEGRKARKLMDDARDALAFRLGCLPQMIIFTGGGTEANSTALRGVGAEHIVVSAVEHPSVLEAARATGKPVSIIPVDGNGVVQLEALKGMLGKPNTLVSVMLANNETGVLQPIAEIAAVVHQAGALLHVDAVQAFGKMPVNFGLLGADLLTVNAHKAGGPVGVGALVVRDGLALEPLLAGGGQELRRRAGTENVLAIAGFGALAAEPLLDLAEMQTQLETALGREHVIAGKTPRLGNTTCLSVPGLTAETALMQLDLAGFAVSSGSACSSGKVGRSHVLQAMGVDEAVARNAIRISLGWNTTAEDVARFAAEFEKLVQRRKARAAA